MPFDANGVKIAQVAEPSSNMQERQVQISFVANACVDIMVDYFKGKIDMPFDDLEKLIISILDKMM